MPRVDVPDVGLVEFPDSMSHDEIVSAIQTKILPQRKTAASGTPTPATAPAPAAPPGQPGMFDQAKELLMKNAFSSAAEALTGKPGFTFTDVYDQAASGAGDLISKVIGTPKEKLRADFPGVALANELVRGIPEGLDFMASPAGAAASVIGARAPGAVPAIGAAFSTDLSSNLPAMWDEYKKNPTAEGLGSLIKTGVFAAAPFLHAAGTELDTRAGAKAAAALEPARQEYAANPPREDVVARMPNQQLAAERGDPLVNDEILRRQKAQAWDVPEQSLPRQNREQRRAFVAVPETGAPEAEARLDDARQRASQAVASKPYEDLPTDEQRIIDELIQTSQGKEVPPNGGRLQQRQVGQGQEVGRQVAPETEPPSPVEGRGEVIQPGGAEAPAAAEAPSILSRLDLAGKAASERLKQRGITTGTSVPMAEFLNPETIRDMAISIAGDVARGLITVEDLAKRLASEYGPRARLMAQRVFDQAQRIVDDPEELSAVVRGPDERQAFKVATEAPPETVTPTTTATAAAPADRLMASPSYDVTKGKMLENVDVSPETRGQLQQTMQDWEARNPDRRTVSFEDIRQQARDLDPRLLLQLDAKKMTAGQTLDPAVRFAAREHLNSLEDEIVQRRKRLASADMTSTEMVAEERKISGLESDAQGLVDVLIPTRSQDGRNLAYHRMMAEKSFDTEYWISRARRSMGLPPGVDLPDAIKEDLRDVLNRGREAERQAEAQAQAPEPPPPAPEPKPAISKRAARREAINGPAAATEPTPAPKPAERKLTPEQRKQQVERDPKVQEVRRELAQKVAKLDRDGILETISAVRKAGLLTGVKTHLRNIGGNTGFQVMEELARLPAAAVDSAIRVVSTGERTVSGPDLRAVARASREAATRGIAEAKQIMRKGATDSDLAKMELPKELNSGSPMLDKAVNSVFRTLSAEDRVFKVYAFERSLQEQMKLAKTSTPTEAMRVQAIADADFATFNNDNLAAGALGTAKAWLRNQGGKTGKAAAFGLDVLIPFSKTPTNVLLRTMEYAGGGALSGGVRLAVAAATRKALTPGQQRSISMSMGRGIIGPSLIYLGWKLAEAGLATGTAQDEPGKRNVEQAANRATGALKVGDRWYQVSPFAPWGTLLTIGATLQRESTRPLKEEAKRPANVAKVATRTVLEMPFLQGLEGARQALENPGRATDQFAEGTAGSFVPTIASDVAGLADTTRRDARAEGLTDAIGKGIAARVPGLRNTLPEQKDVFGRSIAQEKTAAVDPTLSRQERTDPVTVELVKRGVGVSRPQRRPGEDLRAYSLRSEITGKLTEQHIRDLVETMDYQEMPTTRGDESRKLAIQKAIGKAHSVVNHKLKVADYGAMDAKDKLTFLQELMLELQ